MISVMSGQPVILRAFTGKKEAVTSDGGVLSVLTYPTVDYAGDYIKPDGGDWSRFHIAPLVNWAHDIPVGRGQVFLKSITFDGKTANVNVGKTKWFETEADLKGLDLSKYDDPEIRNKIGEYTAKECLSAAAQVQRLVADDIATGVSIEFSPAGKKGDAFWERDEYSIMSGRPALHFERWNGLAYAHARQPVNPGCRTAFVDSPEMIAKAVRVAETGKIGDLVLSPVILKSFRELAETLPRRVYVRGVDLSGSGAHPSPGTPARQEPTFAKGYLSPTVREHAEEHGDALPGGRFPIRNTRDLKNAIRDIGRANNRIQVKKFIKKRAKELGATHLLPTSWRGSKSVDRYTRAIDPENYTMTQLFADRRHSGQSGHVYETDAESGYQKQGRSYTLGHNLMSKMQQHAKNLPVGSDYTVHLVKGRTASGQETGEHYFVVAKHSRKDKSVIAHAVLTHKEMQYLAGRENQQRDASRGIFSRALRNFTKVREKNPNLVVKASDRKVLASANLGEPLFLDIHVHHLTPSEGLDSSREVKAMKSDAWISRKIGKIMREGIKGKKVSQKQAVAIAYSMAGRETKALDNKQVKMWTDLALALMPQEERERYVKHYADGDPYGPDDYQHMKVRHAAQASQRAHAATDKLGDVYTQPRMYSNRATIHGDRASEFSQSGALAQAAAENLRAKAHHLLAASSLEEAASKMGEDHPDYPAYVQAIILHHQAAQHHDEMHRQSSGLSDNNYITKAMHDPADFGMPQDLTQGSNEPSPGARAFLNFAQLLVDGAEALEKDGRQSDDPETLQYVKACLDRAMEWAQELQETAEAIKARQDMILGGQEQTEGGGEQEEEGDEDEENEEGKNGLPEGSPEEEAQETSEEEAKEQEAKGGDEGKEEKGEPKKDQKKEKKRETKAVKGPKRDNRGFVICKGYDNWKPRRFKLSELKDPVVTLTPTKTPDETPPKVDQQVHTKSTPLPPELEKEAAEVGKEMARQLKLYKQLQAARNK